MNLFLNNTARRLQAQHQLVKIAIVASADLITLMFCVFAAFALRVSNFQLPPIDRLHLYLIAPLFSIFTAAMAGVYHSPARSYSNSIERRLVASQLVVPLLWSFVLLFWGVQGFARSTVLIYCLLSIGSMLLIRRLAALLLARIENVDLAHHKPVRVLIYGAGREGLMLFDALKRRGRHKCVGFVDTDYTLVGRMVGGLLVHPTESLERVVQRYDVEEAIIAKPDLSRSNRRVLVDKLLASGLKVKIMPGLSEILEGKVDISDVRPVRLEDLLGRDPVPPDRDLMEKAVKGRVVMVTGAGGSIGSELVRQAFSFAPKKMVMLDNGEHSLFEINREMEDRLATEKQGPTLHAVLADVGNQTKMLKIMQMYGVDIVFHAAAYKHVRMVQENVPAGLTNNIWGTWSVAEAAIKAGVKRFVLVSTDKAVRPTSVMGASKRMAEMVIQALAAAPGEKPIFSMVRFGNVLGSTGSVVPLFREQIAKGGPVLVTDPEVTRYFMLIPEAAQLVIQAGAMAEGGEVFVLDMGESVKIVQLAETMIELAGLTLKTDANPEGDIAIKFIGLRAGEKLYEELQIGSDVAATNHPRIMRSREVFYDLDRLSAELDKLRKLMTNNREEAVKLLMTTAHFGSN